MTLKVDMSSAEAGVGDVSSLVLKLRVPHVLELSDMAPRGDHWYVFMLQLRVAMTELQRDVPLAGLKFEIYPRELPSDKWPRARSLIHPKLQEKADASGSAATVLPAGSKLACRSDAEDQGTEGERARDAQRIRDGTAALLVLEGHLIRSAFLSRVLIEIHRAHGQFQLLDLLLGRKPLDNPSEGLSFALLLVTMPHGREALDSTIQFLVAMAKQVNALKNAEVTLNELTGDELPCGFSPERVVEHERQLPSVASSSKDTTIRHLSFPTSTSMSLSATKQASTKAHDSARPTTPPSAAPAPAAPAVPLPASLSDGAYATDSCRRAAQRTVAYSAPTLLPKPATRGSASQAPARASGATTERKPESSDGSCRIL